MPRLTDDDLCSMVSTISSAYTGLEEDENGGGHDDEPLEMKYVPPIVKTEILEDTEDNLTGEGCDDEFLARYLARENLDQIEDTENPSASSGSARKSTAYSRSKAKKSSRRSATKIKNLYDDAEDDKGDNDDNIDNKWVSSDTDDDDDWLESTKKRPSTSKRKVTRKKKQSGSEVKKDKTKMSIEERRRKDAERKREQRRLLKSLNNSEGLKSELDGNVKTEPNEAGAPRRRRKRASEMTPEEAEQERAKWREQRRALRAKERALIASVRHEATGESDASSMSASDKRKNRISGMSPEERAILLEQRRVRDRERKRMQRALAKERALPDDQLKKLEEQARKDRERKKMKRALIPKKKREVKETPQRTGQKRTKKEKTPLTEDEKREKRMQNYMQRMARLARMTKEEKEALRLKERERRVARYYKLKEAVGGEEELRKEKEKRRESMTPEEREKARAKFREYYRKRIARLKQEGKFEEVKRKWREQNYRYKRMMMEKSEEERPTSLRTPVPKTNRRRGEGPFSRNRKGELTEEGLAKRRENGRIYSMRRKLTIQNMLDSGMSMEEINNKMETREQREHRLIMARIRKARRLLRNRLRAQGVSEEEIERQVKELHSTYRPNMVFRPYKPRPECRTRLDPARISEEERLRLQRVGTIRKSRTLKSKPSEKPGVESETEAIKEIGIQALSSPPPLRKKAKTSETNHQQHSAFQRGPSLPIQQQPSTSTQNYRTLVHSQQQQYSNFGSSMYPHSSQTNTLYPHQQSQVPPQQYTLQHLLDGINYQESGGASTSAPPIGSQPVNYNSYNASTTSSQHEYGSSYYDDDNHSPPPSSPPGGDYEDNPSSNYYNTPQQTVQKPLMQATSWSSTSCTKSETLPKRKGPGRPRKNEPRVKGAPKVRKQRANVVWDVICDICGQPYNNLYLKEHKQRLHNPNYDLANRKCLICGEKYTNADTWYKHYIRTHKKPDQGEKKVVCEQCGKGLSNQKNYQMHVYHVHGEGRNKENYIRCPICPEEKLYSRLMCYRNHLQRRHPEYVRTGHDCYRCDESYPNEKVLGDHVKVTHPESYFPCPFCTAFRFTKLALNFHLIRCSKPTKKEKDEWRNKNEGLVNFEMTKIPCEYCKAMLSLGSMARHYKELHRVVEDQFKCEPCRKLFKRRAFWATHLEERHQMDVEEIKKLASKLNAVNKEGLVEKPAGTRGGSRNRKKKSKPKIDDDSNDEKEQESECLSGNQKVTRRQKKTKQRRKKRKIIVIAEEDEVDDSEESSEESSDSSSTTD